MPRSLITRLATRPPRTVGPTAAERLALVEAECRRQRDHFGRYAWAHAETAAREMAGGCEYHEVQQALGFAQASLFASRSFGRAIGEEGAHWGGGDDVHALLGAAGIALALTAAATGKAGA